nr:flagellar biosynthetic protein FliR [Tabrizicola sp. TH137]
MIELATALMAELQPHLRPATLTFLRIAAAMALLPAFGEQTIPMRVRLALALAFTALVLPVVAERHVGDGLLLPAAAETAAGLMIGLSLRLMVMGLQMAATIAAQSTSLSQLFAGVAVEPLPALGTLFTWAALALAVQAGLHVKLTALFIASHDLLPAGRFPTGADLAAWGSAHVARVSGLAFSLALPFVLAGLLWNVALGAVNRAMPQLMMAFIGAPALALGSLVLTALTTPVILALWLRGFDATLAHPFMPASP